MVDKVITDSNVYTLGHPLLPNIHIGLRGIFQIKVSTKNTNRPCSICNGIKKVKIKGEEFQCPKCKGNTTGERWYSEDRHSLVEYSVGSIYLEAHSYNEDIHSTCEEKTPYGRYPNHTSVKLYLKCLAKNAVGYIHNTNIQYDKISEYFKTREETLDLVAEVERTKKRPAILSSLFFIDKPSATQLQRALNKIERDKVAKYVEEKARLKENITETNT